MKKSITLMLAALAGTAFISTSAMAAKGSDKDPYTASMQSYAKENPALSQSLKAYQQELKKVMKSTRSWTKGPQVREWRITPYEAAAPASAAFVIPNLPVFPAQ